MTNQIDGTSDQRHTHPRTRPHRQTRTPTLTTQRTNVQPSVRMTTTNLLRLSRPNQTKQNKKRNPTTKDDDTNSISTTKGSLPFDTLCGPSFPPSLGLPLTHTQTCDIGIVDARPCLCRCLHKSNHNTRFLCHTHVIVSECSPKAAVSSHQQQQPL